MSSPPRDLFDDDDDDVESAEQRLKVNKRYAQDYQTRKQREELRNHRDEVSDSDSSTSESEDEDGDLLSPSVDVSILKTIHALRTKDASIYDPSNRFFPVNHDEHDSSGTETKKKKKRVPKKFKDVIREQIVEQMEQEEAVDMTTQEHDDDVPHDTTNTNPLEYNQEQSALRSAFLESTRGSSSDDEDDGDNWMVLKKRDKQNEKDDETDRVIHKELEALEHTTTASPLKDPRGEVQDGDKFLLDFIKNKKWIDKDDHDSDSDQEDDKQPHDDDDNDSIDELDRADDFESKYNFRFEEAAEAAGTSGADFSNVGYARGMDTLRRKDDSRIKKRLERKERKLAERKQKEEQLRRLKNAKRAEMEAKLQQVKSVLGEAGDEANVDEATLMKLMEGDYDPEKFESIMKEAYGDEYYEKPDAEWKTDRDVRHSLLETEDGDMIVGQDDVEGGLYDNEEYDGDYEGYAEEHGDGDAHEEWDEYEQDGDEAYEHDESGYEETETEKKLREKMMDELYKLDYEDIVAGMPTRFKYRKVEKNDYGLSTEEILFAKDSTLKSYVSLKKMAPYRQDGEHRVGNKKRRRFREMLKQDVEETMEEQPEGAGQIVAAEDGGEEGPPKKKRRRRQKKGKKQEEDVTNETKASAKANVERKEATPVSGKDDSKDEARRKKKKKQTERAASNGGNAKGRKPKEKRKKNRTVRKRHRGKKKKSISVEGVSASRLASYNL